MKKAVFLLLFLVAACGVSFAQTSQTGRVLYARQFGAKCDGVTNDQSTITAAITAATATGGIVDLPEGTCVVTGLSVPGGVWLRGKGKLITTIKSSTNGVIVNAVQGSGAFAFFGPKITDLTVDGSDSGAAQVGIQVTDATYVRDVVIEDVQVTDCGSHGFSFGLVFSSSFKNLYSSSNGGYPFFYNSPNMPSNYFYGLYAGDISSAAPAGYRIKQGTFTCWSCNGVNTNAGATGYWAVIGGKNGDIDGDSTAFYANARFEDCNIEGAKTAGVLNYPGSVPTFEGETTFVGLAASSGSWKAIDYDTDASLSPETSQRGYIADTVIFSNSPITFYANSQPVHADGNPPVSLNGQGLRVAGHGIIGTYYNSANSRAEQLNRADGAMGVVAVSATTSFTNPGMRYLEVTCVADCTQTLPYPGFYVASEFVTVKNLSATGIDVTIAANGGASVNGSTYVISTQGESVIVVSSGSTDWRIVANRLNSGTANRVPIYTDSSRFTTVSGFEYDSGSSVVKTPARFWAADTSAAFPSFAFTSDTDTGFYRPASNQIGVSLGGSGLYQFGTSGLTLGIPGTTAGALILGNSSNSNTTTLNAGAPSSSISITLPATLPASAGCLQINSSGVISQTGSACGSGGGGSTAWSAITDPTTGLALSMGSNVTSFTWNNNTSTANMFALADGASNTGTGYVLSLNTASGSAAKPVRITANGVVNGVEMTTAGSLQVIGTGGIVATTGDSATGFFTAGQIEAARGGTGIDSSGSTGVVRVSAGSWLTNAGIQHLAASSSADLRGVLTDETGTGAAVFAGGNIGAATATTLNGLTISATTGTLTIANGKTLTFNNTVALSGTDGTTMTFPVTTTTVAGLGIAQTFTALQTINPGTTPATALLIDINSLGSAGTRDSNWLVFRGRSNDGTARLTEWKQYVDVTANAGTSQLVFESRIDAAAFGARVTIGDDGAVSGGAFSGDSFTASGGSILDDDINAATGFTVAGAAASGQYLRGNGTRAVFSAIQASDLPGSFSGFANPSATIGLTAVNGSATTAMRSDAAPAISQSITPTWTASHTFAATMTAREIDPQTDNTYDLGTTSLRWKTVHVGPGSLIVHNDATNTLKATLGFSGSTAQLTTDSSTPLQLRTGANNGIFLNTNGSVGFNLATTTNGNFDFRQIANGDQIINLRRATDTSPTGNFINFENAAGTDLFTVDITGSLSAGTVPTARLSGTLAATNFPALTGDVTTSAGSVATTIAANAVTNAKLAQVATATFKGRTTSGTGNVEDLTATQATALLDTFTSSAKGLVPASGGGTTNFLRADGTWAAPGGGGSGNVTTAGGTSGRFTKFTSGTNIENALLTESGNDLSATATLTLTNAATSTALIVGKSITSQTANMLSLFSTTDANPRVAIDSSFRLQFGPGGATSVDTNLYRQAANTLRTDGTFNVGSSAQFSVNSSGNIVAIRGVTTSFPSANASGVLTNDGSGNLTWASAAGAFTASSGIIDFTTSTDRLRLIAGSTSTTPLEVDGVPSQTADLIQFKATSGAANPIVSVSAAGRLQFGAGGGSAVDVNLYRSGADALKTDDSFDALTITMAGIAVLSANNVVSVSGKTLTSGNTIGDVTMNLSGTDATGDEYSRNSSGVLIRRPAYNVRAFGAVCDGSTTNDRAAIQAAIDAAGSNGAVSFEGCAQTRIDTGLTIGNGSGTYSTGSGTASTINYVQVEGHNVQINWYGSAGGTVFTVNGPITGVRIRDMKINMKPSTNAAGIALDLNHPRLSEFSGIEIENNSDYGVRLRAYGAWSGGDGANSNIFDNVVIASLQTGAKGFDIGHTDVCTGCTLDPAQNVFRNIRARFDTGVNTYVSGSIGLRLNFTDASQFDQVIFAASTAVQVNVPTGTNGAGYPAGLQFNNAALTGTTSFSVNGSWAAVERLYFANYLTSDGQTIPSSIYTYGSTSQGQRWGYSADAGYINGFVPQWVSSSQVRVTPGTAHIESSNRLVSSSSSITSSTLTRSTTLSAAVTTTSQTTITVTDGSWMPSSVLIKIGSEQMSCTRSSNTLTCTRNVNGTTATTHSNGATVNAAFWYHLYIYESAISPSTITLDVSTTAPAAAYSNTARSKTSDNTRRYVGSVRCDLSGNISNFTVEGLGNLQEYRYLVDATSDNRILTNVTASSNTTVETNSVTSVYTPPIATSIYATFYNLATTSGTALFDTNTSGSGGSGLNPAGGTGVYAIDFSNVSSASIPLNSTQQFRYSYAFGAPVGGGLYVDLLGFKGGR